jgi:hypothetical protein
VLAREYSTSMHALGTLDPAELRLMLTDLQTRLTER